VSTYSEFRYYCGIQDRDMARISMSGVRGGEYYMIVPDDGGKRYREARDAALDAIEAAIRAGCHPGKVKIMEAA
jgi:hypothetical protein